MSHILADILLLFFIKYNNFGNIYLQFSLKNLFLIGYAST